jgi:molybdopterin synthase catalytic subunit
MAMDVPEAGAKPFTIRIRVQPDIIDVATELGRVEADGSTGALASFTGYCRDEGGTLEALELEHYPGMAESKLDGIASEAVRRFGLAAITVTHRHGRIKPGEVIVFVAAASRHRDAAFDGARFVMDYLKTNAPFWKKEHRKDGSTGWVSAKEADDAAAARWA